MGAAWLIVTFLIAWMAIGVRSRAIGWIDAFPNWAFLFAIANGACNDESALASLRRRLDDDPGFAPRARDALLARLTTTSDLYVAREWAGLEIVLSREVDVDPSTLGPILARCLHLYVNEEGSIAIGGFHAAPKFPRLWMRIDSAERDGDGIALTPPLATEDPRTSRPTWVRAGEYTRLVDHERTADEDATSKRTEVHPPLTVDLTLLLLSPAEYDAGQRPDTLSQPPLTSAFAKRVYMQVRVTASPTTSFRPSLSEPPSGVSVPRWGDVLEGESSPRKQLVYVGFAGAVGAVFGLACVAIPVAGRAVQLRRALLSPPRCRRCGSVLPGDGRIDARCVECGRMAHGVATFSRVEGAPRSWRIAGVFLGLIAVAATAPLLWIYALPLASPPLILSYASHLMDDSIHWQVKRVAAGTPEYRGIPVSVRLSGLMLEGTMTPDPSLVARRQEVMDALVAWRRDSDGRIEPAIDDPDGLLRRLLLFDLLEAVGGTAEDRGRPPMRGSLMPASVSDEDRTALLDALRRPIPPHLLPLVVRSKSKSAHLSYPVGSFRGAIVQLDVGLLATASGNEEAGTSEGRSMAVVATISPSSSSGQAPPTGAAPFDTQTVRVLWLSPDTMATPSAACMTDVVPRARLNVWIPASDRFGNVVLEPTEAPQGVRWKGTWTYESEPPCRFYEVPSTTAQRRLVAGSRGASDPPASLMIHFQPDTEWSPLDGFQWPRATTFHFVRDDAARGLSGDARYRLEHATVE